MKKTYKDYYREFSKKINGAIYSAKTEFWKELNYRDSEVRGTYLFPSENYLPTKSDTGIHINLTRVKNSKYDILYTMLTQHLVDYLREHNLYYVSNVQISVEKIIDGKDCFYVPKIDVYKKYSKGLKRIDNFDLEEYLTEFCEIIDRFVTDNFYDIPLEMDKFLLYLEEVEYSYDNGQWGPYTDGYMNFSNGNKEAYVVCI